MAGYGEQGSQSARNVSARRGTAQGRNRIYLRFRSVVLTVMACVGLISMLLFIGSMAFGLHPMVVISASMEPEITVGSLIVSIETTATSLERGDVITVRRSETRRLVTHRIVEVHGCNDGQCTFTLKGDANIARDPHQVTIDSAPRLLIAVPAVGYGVVWMRSIPGLVVLAVTLVLLAFLVIFAPNSHGKDEQRSEAKPDSE